MSPLSKENIEEYEELTKFFTEIEDLLNTESKYYLLELMVTIREQQSLAYVADDPTEHEQNLRHLMAQVQGEECRKKMKQNKKMNKIFRMIAVYAIRLALAAI